MLNKVVAGFSLVIAFTLLFTVACNNLKPVQREASMSKALTVPTLDSQIPPVTETATFALG